MLSRLLFDNAITTEALFGELALAAAIVVAAGARFTKLADTLASGALTAYLLLSSVGILIGAA